MAALLQFLSTLSLRRATGAPVDRMPSSSISIHALLAESDICVFWTDLSRPLFLSTLSLRRATASQLKPPVKSHNFYPRSPCGERLHYDNYNLHCVEISIHALLAESDHAPQPPQSKSSISIHALLAESDRPTLFYIAQHTYFYPRSPCGERQTYNRDTALLSIISIHALLAESDLILAMGRSLAQLFLSTLSLRRATAPSQHPCPRSKNFYPRSPCGERH